MDESFAPSDGDMETAEQAVESLGMVANVKAHDILDLGDDMPVSGAVRACNRLLKRFGGRWPDELRESAKQFYLQARAAGDFQMDPSKALREAAHDFGTELCTYFGSTSINLAKTETPQPSGTDADLPDVDATQEDFDDDEDDRDFRRGEYRGRPDQLGRLPEDSQ